MSGIIGSLKKVRKHQVIIKFKEIIREGERPRCSLRSSSIKSKTAEGKHVLKGERGKLLDYKKIKRKENLRKH